MSRLPEGPLSEFVLLVVVMASESLLFLKIRRMILLIVLIALLILWLRSTLSSHSWKMCTFYLEFFLSAAYLPFAPFLPFSSRSPFRCVEFRVVEVAGFVLRDPFDSPGFIPFFIGVDVYLILLSFSPRILRIFMRGLC